MKPGKDKERWLATARAALDPLAQAQFLSEILNVSDCDRSPLCALVYDSGAVSLYRCAALDRYLELRVYEIRRSQTIELLIETLNWLDPLLSFRTEQTEEVRRVAIQWLAQLEDEAAQLDTAGYFGEAGKRRSKWKHLAREDPSPYIQWLASLGEPTE